MMRFKNIEELVSAVDAHNGNCLYGDLWRLALLAKESIRSSVLSRNLEQSYLDRLTQAIAEVENRWTTDAEGE